MDVPCNGCRKCCIADLVRILPHEYAGQWQTQPHPLMPGARMLAHKPNRECVYLGPDGCTIHDQPRPQQCVTMDCRNIARTFTYTQARKLPGDTIRIWKHGRRLLAAPGGREG